MPIDQNGDNRPKFDELLKRQVNPLLQQGASEQRLLKDAEGIVTGIDDETERTFKQQKLQGYLNAREAANGILDVTGIKDKLEMIRRNVWRRGSMHFNGDLKGEEEPKYTSLRPIHVYSPYQFEHGLERFVTGYKLVYDCPAVVDAEGVDLLKVSSRLGYDSQKFFPVSDRQELTIKVAPEPPYPILISSSSQLILPEKFGIAGSRLMTYLPEDGSIQFPDHYKVAGSSVQIDLLLPQLRIPQLIISQRPFVMRLYPGQPPSGQYYTELDIDSDGNKAADTLDQFLVQDSIKRYQEGKLPLQTKAFWAKYIKGPDSFDNHYDLYAPNCKVPADVAQYYWHATYYDTWEKGWINLDKIQYSTVANTVSGQLDLGRIDRFKFDFEDLNKFSFDEVVEWMRSAPRLRRAGVELAEDHELSTINTLVDRFNDVSFNLELHPDDPELIRLKEQTAIFLMLLKYPLEINHDGSRRIYHRKRFIQL